MKQQRGLLFIEWLVRLKARSVFTGIHFWLVILFTVILGYLHYRLGGNSYKDIYSLLFFYPMMYAAVSHRMRGVIYSGLAFVAVLLIPWLLQGGDGGLILRSLLFGLMVLLLSGLVATLLNYSEMQLAMMEDLRQLVTRVGSLGLARREMLRFFNMAAHDMKAPLAAMQSYFRFILDGYSGTINDEQKKIIERSSRRSDSLMMLIADLLDISRLESGDVVGEMQTMALDSIIRDVIDEIRPRATARQLSLMAAIDEHLPPVNGNPERLQQVFTNLLDNAVRYTSQGGITVRARPDGAEVLVEIDDTGIGIKPDDKPRIFDDFFRAGDIDAEGAGLGLGISRRIIEAHKGRLCVESPCPGSTGGSRFTVALPVSAEKQPGG